jgi:hypothetical protein
MVLAARRGVGLREIARLFGVHLRTVQRWVGRAGKVRLTRADFGDRPSGPRGGAGNRTSPDVERLVLELREKLRQSSPLGEYGAVAIAAELRKRQANKPESKAEAVAGEDASCESLPSVRTIGRILLRHGVLDGRARVRRVPPPRGWYLPGVARGLLELDSFDTVTDLVIKGGLEVCVLNGMSLHGGLPMSCPRARITAKNVVEELVGHWREFGLPGYAQFDNDTLFQGAHQHRDSFGRVTRLCLSLGVTPVFAPPRETGFQAAIESYNARWQEKVWRRFTFSGYDDLQQHSLAYVSALRERLARRLEAAPSRRAFPRDWQLDLQAPLQGSGGRVIYLRRTNVSGRVSLLGHDLEVSSLWIHRLVRATVDLDAGSIAFHALRRREPDDQRLLKEVTYTVPNRRFIE